MEHCLIIFEEKQKNYGFCEKFTKRREKYVYKNWGFKIIKNSSNTKWCDCI